MPDDWHEMPVHFEGTHADAGALAAARLWLHCRKSPHRPADIQCIGWFRPIWERHFHEIRMHPVNIDVALKTLCNKSGALPVHAAIRPFASTLFAYPCTTWADLFKTAALLLVITPPYEGCTVEDCERFVQQLCHCGIQAQCVSYDQAHEIAKQNEFWLWIGANDIL